MSAGPAAANDESAGIEAALKAMAGPQQEEFDRLRLRLQLTNMRIARLYSLVKGQKGDPADEEAQSAVEELFISDAEFQAHLGVLCGSPSSVVSDPDHAELLASLDRAIAVLRRRVQAVELSARRKGRQSRFEQLCARC